MVDNMKRAVIHANPVEASTNIIDSGELVESFQRLTNDVSEITSDIAIVESFSHMIAFKTNDGLVCFDSSGANSGTEVVSSLRQWSTDPVAKLVYTHGHIDHVGGSGALAADAEARGYSRPSVVGHHGVKERFERYQLTNGWNNSVNIRQFGGISKAANMSIGGDENMRNFLPADAMWPDVDYTQSMQLPVGGTTFDLFHDKGETDDHTWAWIPEHKALCAGDFVTWVFPNCGNPQKVQRFPREWSIALRKMQALKAEWLFGAHGLPVYGAERVDLVLDTLATALEHLVETTLEMMNRGESLDAIIHEVSLPPEMIKPWMYPVYDEPEFVVRNIWRQYGGWWNLNPAQLKPAADAVVASEIASLSGGVDVLTDRAAALAADGDLKLACHLIEFAVQADPASARAHGVRAEIYQQRRNGELSVMSKGVFSTAANESRAIANPEV